MTSLVPAAGRRRHLVGTYRIASNDAPVVDRDIYLSLGQSLGAAQAVAQWARWKTVIKLVICPQRAFRD